MKAYRIEDLYQLLVKLSYNNVVKTNTPQLMKMLGWCSRDTIKRRLDQLVKDKKISRKIISFNKREGLEITIL